MHEKLFPICHAIAVLLALSGGPIAAQELDLQAPAAPQAQVGTAFTYQGRLVRSGNPVTATCEMTFALYDGEAGNLVASPVTATVVVAGGLFTVPVDFGYSSYFDGDARWLEIAVKCPGDADFVVLTSRQELTPSPYALSLRPGARVEGEVLDGFALSVTNSIASGAAVGVEGTAFSTSGVGVIGMATATTGYTYGVRGLAISETGIGVHGAVNTPTGVNCGVYGRTASPSGYGVYGAADSPTNGTGVHGQAHRYGVWGVATTTTGPSSGVAGHTDSDVGSGVYGYADSETGANHGVYGITDSTEGYGVYGYAHATGGTNYGVYGKSDAPTGRAVAGHATSTTGVNYGVLGRSSSPNGYGVYAAGNIGASGTKSAVVQTRGFGFRHLYAMESPEVLFEDVGTARLKGGRATVVIDRTFAETVNLRQPYQVFATWQGEGPVLLWVSAKTATSFTVRGVSLDGQPAAGSFDYRVIAKRLGYEDVRLGSAADPKVLTEETVPAATP